MEKFTHDVTSEDFEKSVIEASRMVPVIVDFWAGWCAPCRVLAPILEKLVAECAGAVLLAKIDTDKNPEISARFGVRGIPSVKAFVDGKVIAEFSGALPESSVRAFLDKVVPSPAQKLRTAAKTAVQGGDFDAAEQALAEALNIDPANQGVRMDWIELLIARQAFPEADLEMQKVPARDREARAERLSTLIEFWRRGQSLPSRSECELALRCDPHNQELRVVLAERMLVEGAYEDALEQLLETVRADRGPLRNKARQTMISVFSLVGEQAEFISRYRRLLASTLN